ncbi:UNVERIFIED_CONTAM: hypothetical protein K2H54_007002 [Gekko kuhli]
MASGAAEMAATSTPVTTTELDKSLKLMEKSILHSIAAMMRPMYEQMENLQRDINENKVGMERALNIGLSNQRDIQQLQQMDNVLAEKALKAEIALRQQNMKIRGWPEKMEEVLAKKRELKSTTSNLAKANIKFSWETPLTLQFAWQGKSYQVSTREEGMAVL